MDLLRVVVIRFSRFLAVIVFATTTARAQIITTVVGDGLGDGHAATNAEVATPEAVAVDTRGSLYIADYDNNRVRKVDSSGVITTVAGNGVAGYAGDGGPAVSAVLNHPSGVAIDGSGNVYIADTTNGCIRKVDSHGIITTVAGNGALGYSGDGGMASNAQLNRPRGLAFNAHGDLYVADQYNNRIREIDTTGTITTIAGTGTAQYSGDGGPATSARLNHPRGMALAGDGSLYIADTGNSRIRKVDTSGVITTVAGNGAQLFAGDGGPATSAEVASPYGVAVDVRGNLYIADTNAGRIREVDSSGIITTVAGTDTRGYSGDGGMATSAELADPAGVTFDASGNLYIADLANNRIRKIDSHGTITTVAGGDVGDNGTEQSALLDNPSGVAFDANGNLYVADYDNNRIRKIDAKGIITTVAGNGTLGYSGDGGLATSAGLYYPIRVTLDGSGNLYIADSGNNVIRKVDRTGIITTVVGTGALDYYGDGGPATRASLFFPTGMAFDNDGNLYIADNGNSVIRKVDTHGIITTVAGNSAYGYSGDGGLATHAELNNPDGVALDASRNLYIADTYNHRIRKVDANGVIATVVGNGTPGYSGDGGVATSAQLNTPAGVRFDAGGNLYVADQYNHRIRKIDTRGAITSIAGDGVPGYSGDGGVATGAELNYPEDIAIGSNGDVYIADVINNRIRTVSRRSRHCPQPHLHWTHGGCCC
jgi:sugar lactone lactonase YvrE